MKKMPALTCTNGALTIMRIWAQNSKMEVLSFHQAPLMLLLYKRMRGCTNRENACTQDRGLKIPKWRFYRFTRPPFDAFDIQA